jgi:hypothetical protein
VQGSPTSQYDGIGVCWMSGGEVVKWNSNFRGG